MLVKTISQFTNRLTVYINVLVRGHSWEFTLGRFCSDDIHCFFSKVWSFLLESQLSFDYFKFSIFSVQAASKCLSNPYMEQNPFEMGYSLPLSQAYRFIWGGSDGMGARLGLCGILQTDSTFDGQTSGP